MVVAVEHPGAGLPGALHHPPRGGGGGQRGGGGQGDPRGPYHRQLLRQLRGQQSAHQLPHLTHITIPAGEQGGGADRVPERDLVADPAVRGGPLQDHAHPATQRHDRGTQPQPRRHRPLHLQGGS